MNSNWLRMTLMGYALTLQGCVMMPQDIHLDPQVTLAKAASADNKVVGLEARDDRQSKLLGMVGVPETRHAEISSTEDAGPALYARAAAGLKNLGFSVKPAADGDDRVLRVEMADLKYKTTKGTGITDEVQVTVNVNGRARNRDEWHDRQFTVTKTMTVAKLPEAEGNTRFINDALAQALKDMLSDSTLIDLLSK